MRGDVAGESASIVRGDVPVEPFVLSVSVAVLRGDVLLLVDADDVFLVRAEVAVVVAVVLVDASSLARGDALALRGDTVFEPGDTGRDPEDVDSDGTCGPRAGDCAKPPPPQTPPPPLLLPLPLLLLPPLELFKALVEAELVGIAFQRDSRGLIRSAASEALLRRRAPMGLSVDESSTEPGRGE